MKNKQKLVNARLKYQDEVKKILGEEYPNLTFLLSPDDKLSVWLKDKRGGSGAGVYLEDGKDDFKNFKEEYFEFLNLQVALAVEHPDKYFYCTECNRVLPIEDFVANVFAGYYCKECAEKPSISKLIEESHKKGFYD